MIEDDYYKIVRQKDTWYCEYYVDDRLKVSASGGTPIEALSTVLRMKLELEILQGSANFRNYIL